MANENKKDFNVMLHDNKDMPKFQTITDQKSIEKYGGSKMYFAPPIDYDKVMKKIPYGKVITVGKIREYFAELNGADFTEPITAGVFVSIVAWASYQRSEDETPYWRTLKANGELNEKYPNGIEAQKEKLEAEGHTILQKGRKNIRYYVKDYEKFLFENAKLPGKRHHILSSLPLCTMSEELLKEILQQNKISTEDAANIFHFVTMQKEIYEQMLYSGPLQDDVPELTREEFEQYPMVLSLSGLFFESDIFYTYEQYLQHLSQTKDYAKEHENYSVTVTHQLPFRNIQIIILEGEWVMVSKNKFPAIHFVIHHPKMCHALENMIVPVMEEE